MSIDVGIARWLAFGRPDLEAAVVSDVAVAEAGLSNDTAIVTVTHGPAIRRRTERLVVRRSGDDPLFPQPSLAREAALQNLVAAAGVPAPAPATAVEDPSYLGAPFLVMPFAEGTVPGAAPRFDTFVSGAAPEAQRRVQDGMATTLTAIHAIDWQAAGAGAVVRGAGSTLAEEVGWWQRYLGWACGSTPVPALADALAWCAETAPADPPHSLLWGDARLGNLVFDRDRQVVAVLDWEMASIGPAELDLGWYLALDRVQQHFAPGQRIEGWLDHDGFVTGYEERAGRSVEHLEWHEIFALARSVAVSVRLARIAESRGKVPQIPGDDRNPMLAILDAWISAAG